MSPLARPHLDPAEKANWASTYQRNRYDELPWFRPGPKPALENALKEGWVQRPGPWLDLGCGAGSDVLWLTRNGIRATGIDVAPGAVAAAGTRARSTRSSASFVVGDVLDLPFPGGHFKGASDMGCFHTLPLKFRRPYAEEVGRVLRPGGRFLLSVAAREAIEEGGPPHRLSVEEVTRSLEEHFLVRRLSFEQRAGRLPSYEVWLERRRSPQPPLR